MYVIITLTLAQKNCKFKLKKPQIWNWTFTFLLWRRRVLRSDLVQPSEFGYSSIFWMHTNYLSLLQSLYTSTVSTIRNWDFWKHTYREWLLLWRNFQNGQCLRIENFKIIIPLYVVRRVLAIITIVPGKIRTS